VIVTAYGSFAGHREALEQGAVACFDKRVAPERVLAALGGTVTFDCDPHVCGKAPTDAALEWEHIHRVLRDCDWNRTQAARRLEIGRSTLKRKLRCRPTHRERV
jgi:two-component system response regulator RegA